MAETLWSKQARGSFLALRKSPDRAELYERVRQRLLILREAPGDGRVRSRRMRIKGGGVWRIDVSGSDEELMILWSEVDGILTVHYIGPPPQN